MNDSISTNEVHIPNYTFIRLARTKESGKSCGGGLGIYIRDHYEIKHVETSTACLPHFESSWLKLSLKNTRPTYICSFYRPPSGSINEFLTSLTEQIQNQVDTPISDIVLLGDAYMNIC